MEASHVPKGEFRAPVPVIQEGHSYRSVTDKLTNLVLTPNTPVTSGAPLAPPPPEPNPTPKPSPDVKMGPLSFAPVAKAADASVVTIYTVGEEDSRGGLFGRKVRGRTAKGLGTGLSTLRERLRLTFAGDARVSVTEEKPRGVRVELEFPAREAGA